jgi:AraC-like DNA-binding protein
MSLSCGKRTPTLLADSNDDASLSMPLSGAAGIRQRRREIMLSRGDAALGVAGETGEGDSSQQLVIGMSLRRLKAIVPGIEDRIAERIPQQTPALRLIMGHIHNWQHGELATTAQMQQMFSDHLYDLIALLFKAKGDVAEQAEQRGGRAARIQQIEREIRLHTLDPDFSLDTLAQRLGVSPRHIQRLLAAQESSVIKQLNTERLKRANQMLCSPTHRRLAIAEIAYQCGFASTEHFYRTFRAHFGVTPGEVRAGVGV